MKKRLKGLVSIWLVFAMIFSSSALSLTAEATEVQNTVARYYKGSNTLSLGDNVYRSTEMEWFTLNYGEGSSTLTEQVTDYEAEYRPANKALVGWNLWARHNSGDLDAGPIKKSLTDIVTVKDIEACLLNDNNYYDPLIEARYVDKYIIDPQPTNETFTVGGKVYDIDSDAYYDVTDEASCQWYKFDAVTHPVVNGEAGNGVIPVDSTHVTGEYDADTNQWTCSEGYIDIYFPVQTGDIITVSPRGDGFDGLVRDWNSDSGFVDQGGVYTQEITESTEYKDEYNLSIQVYGDPILPISFAIAVTRTALASVDGQTDKTLTASEDGTYVCKLTFPDEPNEVVLTSDPVNYTAPAPAETHRHDMSVACGGSGVIYTPWDGTTAFPGGNVYLTGDVTLTETLTISSGTVDLCLNGNNITSSGITNAITVSESATLNICDCQATAGSISATSDGDSITGIDNSGSVNVYGSTIKATGSGAYTATTIGIENKGIGSVNIYGGAVEVTSSCNTWDVQNNAIQNTGSGTVNICGGTVKATNTIYYGTGTGIKNAGGGSVNVSDGEIDGLSTGLYNVSGTLTVSGGTVKGESTGISANSDITVSGSPWITGGCDIALYGNSKIIIGDVLGTLTDTISVDVDPKGTFTSGWTTEMDESAENYDSFFTAWSNSYTVQPDGSGELKLAKKPTTYTVTGIVQDHENIPLENVKVNLMQGNELYGQTRTDADGQYTFSNIPAGIYNIVAERDGVTMTILVTVSNANVHVDVITMPEGNVNSKLEVEDDSATPDVVVDGLQDEAEAVKDENGTATEVTVTMTIKAEAVDAGDSEQTAIKDAAPTGATIEYLDITVEKTVVVDGDTDTRPIPVTNSVLEIVVPYDFSNKKDVTVYRKHGDEEAVKLRALASKPDTPDEREDGTFFLDKENGRIHIYAKKFSVYAIGYAPEDTHTITLNANGGTVSGSSVAFLVTGTDKKLSDLPDAVRSGYTFNGWYTAETGGEVVTTATVFADDGTIYAQWTEEPAPTPPANGGGSYTPTYAITVEKSENGAVKANRDYASSGSTVTITVTPEDGYVLKELSVTDSQGNKIEVTDTGDGTFTFKMPSRKVTVEASFMADGSFSVCPKDNTCPIWPYTDAETTAWYHDGVHYCIENGLMAGYGDGIFKPNADTTRAMITVMLWRLNGSPVVNYLMDFEDVEDGKWYTEAIRWAKSEGIAEGYGNGFFGTNDAITREQMVTILWRYAQYKGIDVSVGEDTNILSYNDAFDVSEYAIPAMQWACGSGMVQGMNDPDGKGMILAPESKGTRAQIATMMMRFCTEIVK